MKNIEAELKQIAIKAAKEAGKLIMSQLGKETVSGTQYGSALCLKTKEDEDSELKIIEVIKSVFPNHAFLGEELGDAPADSEYKWIIDPIDGTNNYIEGRDTFSVSIGLEHNGEIILGVVFLPKRNELFVAEKGKGATLDDKPIHINDASDLSKAVVTYSTMPGSESETEKLDEKIMSAIPNVKYFGFKSDADIDPTFGRGSMAAEFCYLACGRINGLIRLKQKPWDVAGGSLVAAEAGAKMVNLEGKECSVYEGDYIASNAETVKKILEIINK